MPEQNTENFYSMNSVSLNEAQETESTIEVLRVGKIYDRNLTITEKMLSDMVNNYKDNAYGNELQVNLGHNRGGEAGGWIKDLFVQGQSLMARVSWTTLGIEKLKNKLYKFVSAEFATKFPHHKDGKVVSNVFSGLALTNVPALKGQSPISLSEEVDILNNQNTMLEEEKKEPVVGPVVQPEAPKVEEPAKEEPKPEEKKEEPKAEPEAPKVDQALSELQQFQVQLSEKEARIQELSEKLAKIELSETFDKQLMLSEERPLGIHGEAKDEVVGFMAELSEAQREAFIGIVRKVRSVDTSVIGSSNTVNLSQSKEEQIVALAEKYLSEGKAKDIVEAQKLASNEVK